MTPRSRALGEEMSTLYAQGRTMADIAQQYGYTKIGVRLRLVSAGVALRREPRKHHKLRKDVGIVRKGQLKGFQDTTRAEQMAALYRGGQTLQAIGDQYNVTRERVRQVLRKAGVVADVGGIAVRSLLSLDKFRAKRDARDARLFRIWGLSGAEYDALVALHGSSAVGASPFNRFVEQRNSAKHRGIAWVITFKEWWTLWQESGRWEQRGRGKGYCMARLGDSGPYSVGNVEIITIGQNFSDSYLVHPWHERFAGVFAPAGTKTHCKHGHAFDLENTYHYKGVRTCRACAAIREQKYRAKCQAERMAA